MPGFIMHMVESRLILDQLEKERHLTDEWKEAFLTGNLLPDTRLLEGKRWSHFWDESHLYQIARAPQIRLFEDKYHPSADEPLIFGYYSHLYLDMHYVNEYWPTVFSFLGEDGGEKIKAADISRVHVKRTGEEIGIAQFFSPEYYYGDYTKMNDYFIRKYRVSMPDWRSVDPVPMEEVRLSDMYLIENLYQHVTECSHMGDEKRTKVFEIDSVEEFLHWSAKHFLTAHCGQAGGEK